MRRSLNAVQIIHGIFTAVFAPVVLVRLGNVESCLCACIFAVVNLIASLAIRGSFYLAKENGYSVSKLDKISSAAAYLLLAFSLLLTAVPMLSGWEYMEIAMVVYINLTAFVLLMTILKLDRKYQ